MLSYTRHQLLLIVMLLAAAGVGFAVREWRAAHPELAERLERFDHVPPRADEPAAPEPARVRRLLPPVEDVTPAPDGTPAVPWRAAIGGPVDLNRATLHDLTRLPGVGPVLAARILEARQSAGRFDSVEDLRDVRGLGGVRLERLRPLLTVAVP